MTDEKRLFITEAMVAAHAEEATRQPWWPLFEAEEALPPCPVCGGRQLLLIDGQATCEDACHERGTRHAP